MAFCNPRFGKVSQNIKKKKKNTTRAEIYMPGPRENWQTFQASQHEGVEFADVCRLDFKAVFRERSTTYNTAWVNILSGRSAKMSRSADDPTSPFWTTIFKDGAPTDAPPPRKETLASI